MSSRPVLGPTQSSIQWVPGALSSEVKRLVCEVDHSPPTSAEVKKTWIHLLSHTPSWRSAQLVKHRGKFTYFIVSDPPERPSLRLSFLMLSKLYTNCTLVTLWRWTWCCSNTSKISVHVQGFTTCITGQQKGANATGWFTRGRRETNSLIVNQIIIYRWKRHFVSTYLGRYGDYRRY
jgi:hypothetical protein